MWYRKVLLNSGCGLLLAAFSLAAECAGSSLIVVAAPAKKLAMAAVRVVANNSLAAPDPAFAHVFESALREYLYSGSAAHFSEGDELTITYRVIRLNEGNAAERNFIGFGVGKGSIDIEIVYQSREGSELAKVNVEGKIVGGALNGNFETAVRKAAKQAADYTLSHFH